MASTPNSLNPTGPAPKMMPEGSRKVCVLNGSRQLDQVVKGEWMTIKVLPENGLPKGIYQLAEATKPDTGKDGKESAYTGQVLHVDSKAVYQLSGKGIVEHGVGLDIENYCTLRLFFDLSTLAGLSRRNFPEAGIRLLFQI